MTQPQCAQKTAGVVFLLLGIFIFAGGSVALRLPQSSDARPYEVEGPLLDEENSAMVDEFVSIMEQYQKLPSNTKRRVAAQRVLLERLNRMKANTPFLQGHVTILQSALRYHLGIEGADTPLYKLAEASPLPSIRDDAVLSLIDRALRRGGASGQKDLERIYNETQSRLSYQLKSFIAVLLRRKDYVSPEEAAYLVNYYLENLVDQQQDSASLSKLIQDLEGRISSQDIDRMIDKFLTSSNPAKALPFVKFRLEHAEADFEELLTFGLRFGAAENQYAAMLRAFPRQSDAVKEYLGLYQTRYQARARGNVYNVTLRKYRGTKKAPYNLEMAQKTFEEYLEGPIEDKYLADNAEKAVRNYLAARRFDLIEQHLALAKSKIWDGYYSPYINFWLGYSRLQLGVTNDISFVLSGIISESPETYFGMMSVELLNRLFKTEPGGAEMKRKLFGALRSDLGSTNRSARVSAAIVMYYLGSKMERGQAETVLASVGMVDNGSKRNLSMDGRSLAEAYLSLGLHNAARRILYREGISNSYEQDIVFGDYFEENDSGSGFYPVYSRKKASALNGMHRIIGNEALKAYYPRPFFEQVSEAAAAVGSGMDEHLIYAVMRTESFYRTNARSHAGARGLMQLMPATARLVARQVLDHTNYSLFDPRVNILLGTTYLSDNMKTLGLIPALAAYNGGPNRVLEVKSKYSPQNIFEFIEVHPIKETRNYMKKVLESYNRYSIIYQGQGLDFSGTAQPLF